MSINCSEVVVTKYIVPTINAILLIAVYAEIIRRPSENRTVSIRFRTCTLPGKLQNLIAYIHSKGLEESRYVHRRVPKKCLVDQKVRAPIAGLNSQIVFILHAPPESGEFRLAHIDNLALTEATAHKIRCLTVGS